MTSHTTSEKKPIQAPAIKNDRLERSHRLKRWLARVPYGVGAKVCALLTRNRLVQAVMSKHRDRMCVFIREQGLDFPVRETFARYLASNYLGAWRLSALARCDENVFDHWVHVSGYEHFSRLQEEKRPVILCNSHYGSGKVILLALMRRGHTIYSLDRQDVFSFFGIRGQGRIISINLGPREQGFMLKQIVQARNALTEGGVLHIAGDGLRGLSGKAMPFLGRERRFPSSVAELAMVTGAAVLPVFGSLDADGRVNLEILPPLTQLDGSASREDLVAHVNAQYCALLEARWRADPGSIFKSEYAIYAGLPRMAAEFSRTLQP